MIFLIITMITKNYFNFIDINEKTNFLFLLINTWIVKLLIIVFYIVVRYIFILILFRKLFINIEI